ncbi:MAG: hypothetical protein E7586_04195 [Ruminococcaceae bacterium]|nr:hypothetical protein [Oscillospiraceae bacterium]
MTYIKKPLKIVLAVFIALVVSMLLFVLSFFINHNFLINHHLTQEFKDIIKSESEIEIIQSKSVRGKLNGNGNGINYFGTVLVKANSDEDLKKLLTKLDEEFETVGYAIQSGEQVNNRLIEHVNLEYDENLSNDETYYSIYYFNASNKYSYPFDIRGH